MKKIAGIIAAAAGIVFVSCGTTQVVETEPVSVPKVYETNIVEAPPVVKEPVRQDPVRQEPVTPVVKEPVRQDPVRPVVIPAAVSSRYPDWLSASLLQTACHRKAVLFQVHILLLARIWSCPESASHHQERPLHSHPDRTQTWYPR